MQQITSQSEKLTKKNIINRISDVPAGVSLAMANLIVGNVVPEGTPLSAPASGVRTVCKQAVLLAGSTTTVLVVETGTHQFKAGEHVMQAVGGVGATISGIVDNGDGTTSITVGTALESAAAGTFIYQSSAAGATAGALTNEADTILKEGFEVPSATQVIYMADAFTRADVLQNAIGDLYLATLKGIIVIKY